MKSAMPFDLPKLPISLSAEEHLDLMRVVVRAHNSLNTLNGLRKIIPTDLFSVFTLTESVQSTRIEGTQATFDEVMEVEATNQDGSVDVQEVRNYRDALNFGVDKIINQDHPITISLIKELHKIILNNSRGAGRAPGEFRRMQNWIGGDDIKKASYVPPIASKVMELMGNLEVFLNEPNGEFDPLIMAGIMHAQFESIHPFLDGNGRVGRLLITLFLLKKGVCDNSIIFVSEELERNKFKYYSLLNNLRTGKPEWYEWLKFFLVSVDAQAKKYIKTAEGVQDLLSSLWKDEKISTNATAQKILVFSFSHPVFTAKNIEEALGITNATANRWLKYFTSKKIVYPNDNKRNVVYRNYDLIDILRRS